MDTLDEIMGKAHEYPRHQTYQDVHPFDLEHYSNQLAALDKQLFHEHNKAILEFWEYSSTTNSFTASTATNESDLRTRMRLIAPQLGRDPMCRFVFLKATLGRKLRITRNLLTLILAYHQALPQFLDLLFLFARDLDVTDLHATGLRYLTKLNDQAGGPKIVERGWSGKDIKICYNLNLPLDSPPVSDASEWTWNMDQVAIHHSFDVETGVASWIIVKGSSRLRSRIESATKDGAERGLSFVSRQDAFRSALAIHLIICEWSKQNWHSYINFLNKQIQLLTKRAKSPLEPPSPASSRPETAGVRQRRGRASEQGHTAASSAANSIGLNPSSTSQSTSQRQSLSAFSINDLQNSHSIEEIVNKAYLNLKVNNNVFSELEAVYKSFDSVKGWPFDLSSQCKEDVARFGERLAGIKNDMAVQQSRVETLSALIANRRSLIERILDDQSISFNVQQSHLAQGSADRMELMTEHMETLTQEMHSMAEQMRQETISMRIMAFIALIFLPGTFTSTLMTTKLFEASDSREARKQFFAIAGPLSVGMILVWYMTKTWYKYTVNERAEKKTQ